MKHDLAIRMRASFYGFAIIGLILLILLPTLLRGQEPEAPATESTPTQRIIHRVEIKGNISPATFENLADAVEQAEAENAVALLVVLDTPGGLMTSMDEMIRSILSSRVPVITYVGPPGASCGSAGVYILYASHLAAMAAATNIGSATPVSMGGGGAPGEDDRIPETAGADDALNMKRKLFNHSIAQMRSLAEFHNRNAEFGVRTITHAENITSTEALRIGAIEIMADSEAELLKKADGRRVHMAGGYVTLDLKDARIQDQTTDFRYDILSILNHPFVAYLLLSGGLLGIMMEITHPGNIFPGAIGAICLILGLYAMQTLPIDYTGVLLMGLGIVFFILELSIMSYGLLSIAGVICFVLGSLMLVESGDDFLGVSFALAITSSSLFSLLMAVLVYKGAQAHRAKKVSGYDKLLTEIGVARKDITPDSGTVFIHSEIWQARTRQETIPAGSRVRVLDKDGLTLIVDFAPANEESGNTGSEY